MTGEIYDIRTEKRALTQEDVETLTAALGDAFVKAFAGFAASLQQIAASQAAQADRLTALEKQVRLNTPVTAKMAAWLNGAIRERARFLLDARGLGDDKKAVNRLAAAIRRDALTRYGVSALKEIPKHEYPVALSMIGAWNNMIAVRDVVRETRK